MAWMLSEQPLTRDEWAPLAGAIEVLSEEFRRRWLRLGTLVTLLVVGAIVLLFAVKLLM